MKKHIMILAALLASTPLQARETVSDDGNELLGYCTDSSYFMQGMCLGYVRGLDAGVAALVQYADLTICRPDNVTVGQIKDVILAYIRRHPAKRHEGNVLLSMYAQVEAWPCK